MKIWMRWRLNTHIHIARLSTCKHTHTHTETFNNPSQMRTYRNITDGYIHFFFTEFIGEMWAIHIWSERHIALDITFNDFSSQNNKEWRKKSIGRGASSNCDWHRWIFAFGNHLEHSLERKSNQMSVRSLFMCPMEQFNILILLTWELSSLYMADMRMYLMRQSLNLHVSGGKIC